MLERYETGVVAPVFAQALLSLIRESGPKARYQDPGARGMLTLALFSHSRYLCGAERMLLNLALLLDAHARRSGPCCWRPVKAN